MKLLHHNESERSRDLLASAPAGVEVIDCGISGIPLEYNMVSAFPSVVVEIPADEYQVPAYGPDGELLGVAWTGHDAYEEVIRMPVSWEAVAQYVALKTPTVAVEVPIG